MSTPDWSSSTNMLDVSSAGASNTDSMWLWGRDLFQVLEDDGGPRPEGIWPVHSGPDDPSTQFHMPSYMVARDRERSTMLRRACSWMLWRLPDEAAYQIAEAIIDAWQVYYGPTGLYRVAQARHAQGEVALEARVGRATRNRSDDPEWSEVKNARRCDLIDRKIQNTISTKEAAELDDLQDALRAYLDRVAPLPMEGAKKLHAELMRREKRGVTRDAGV
jgi:hypothetical protein